MSIFWQMAGIWGLIAAVVIVSQRQAEKKFKDTLATVLGDPSFQWDDKNRSFRWQGRSYRYQKTAGSRNSPASFSILMECERESGDFVITREGETERFFKNVGLTREVQTGDEAFDQQCFIDSGTPRFAGECLASPSRRDAVRRLLDLKAVRLVCRDKTLSIVWTGNTSHTDGIARLKEVAEGLAAVAQDLPQYHGEVPVSSVGFEGASLAVLRTPVIAFAVMAAVAGVVGLVITNGRYPPLDPWGLFFFSLKFSVLAFAAFLWFSVSTLAGRSRSHRDFLTVGLIALAGFLLSGYAAAGLMNGMTDTARPDRHTALILNKEIHTGKNSRSYHLHVRAWKPGRLVEDLTTNGYIYRQVVCGKDHAQVVTRPGKLGFEWLVTWQFEAAS